MELPPWTDSLAGPELNAKVDLSERQAQRAQQWRQLLAEQGMDASVEQLRLGRRGRGRRAGLCGAYSCYDCCTLRRLWMLLATLIVVGSIAGSVVRFAMYRNG